MKKIFFVGIFFVVLVFGVSALAGGKGEVKYPEGYRDWTHIKSMVIEEGHPLYEAFGGLHHIYANKKARKAMKKGGPYPRGSVIVFDLLTAVKGDNSVTEGPRKVVGVMEKNTKKFAATGGWGFEGFKGDSRERVVKDPVNGCFKCHEPQKKSGYVFSTYRK
ncbi:MAG: cytochrome P460 family protein [Thermodesulfobacteriota bacterium]